MKILHTSDWHLGHKLYGYDRTEEQQAFLHQIAVIVKAHQPDVMIVSGDVFDIGNPATEVQKMYVDALLHIRAQKQDMPIVITAGNHDSYSRIEVNRMLWKMAGVYMVGNMAHHADRSADYEPHVIRIGDKGFVAAVPFCYEQNFPQVPEGVAESRQGHFFRKLLDVIDAQNHNGLPVVLMAHLAVTGCDITGHRDNVGGMEYTPLDQLGTGYDYLALGHIHRPQFVEGGDRKARYSGAPVAVSFDEAYPHSVSIVEIDRHGETPRCTPIEIINPHPLVTLPVNGALPFDETLALLRDFDAEKAAYIRLNVLSDNGYLLPDCTERALEICRNKACKFCYVNRIIAEEKENEIAQPTVTIREIKEMSDDKIIDIAFRYHGLNEEQRDMLRQVIQLVNTEDKI